MSQEIKSSPGSMVFKRFSQSFWWCIFMVFVDAILFKNPIGWVGVILLIGWQMRQAYNNSPPSLKSHLNKTLDGVAFSMFGRIDAAKSMEADKHIYGSTPELVKPSFRLHWSMVVTMIISVSIVILRHLS